MRAVRIAASSLTASVVLILSAVPASAQIRGYEYFSPPPVLGPHALHELDPDLGTASVPAENAGCPATPQDRVLSGVAFNSGIAFVGPELYGLDWEGGLGPDIFLFRYLLDGDSCTVGERLGGVAAPVGFTNLESLAYCPTNGKLYSASTPNNFTVPGNLIEIDPLTGIGVIVGSPLPLGLFVRGMAHDPTTGLLLAVGKPHAGEVSQLWTINKETAAATAIGPTGRSDLESLALDLRGAFPRILAGGMQVHELDRSTGAATLVGGGYPGILYAMASPRVPCVPEDPPDRDGDGIADCADDCPDDTDKIEPGDCGCGNVETGDSDGDGVSDCIDGCPNDVAKIEPGECGCGEVETGDSDGDGVHDCNDGCPDDIGKTVPGECGCGEVETGDSDGDGVHDCNDGCPDDIGKTVPGDCGCGEVETGDSDGDGTPDCNDNCPDDIGKTEPGDCGCGEVETGDSDGDGTPDCIDNCPDDIGKTEPGDCGCGEVETGDSDGDGVQDCIDDCPDDLAKTEPGECGCGNVETGDSDGDGVHDCNDACPDDIGKTEPGECGCGEVETGDSDGDGTLDCNDDCPNDADKTEPGECGCAEDETGDSDGDGAHDCNEDCPSDPDKLVPGVCGCGVPDVDVTGDTVPDCACQAGDVHPHGTGDGLVNAADWLIARQVTELGTLPEDPNDLRCGDQAPGSVECHEPSGTGHWCVTAADGVFGSADTLAIRPLAAGVHVASCEPCLSGTADPEADQRLPGDVVPATGVDISDVLQVLRWAVFLDDPPDPLTDPLGFCQADVAPTHFEGALSVVDGDGAIDISDVLKLLRVVVGLEQLAWQERALQVLLRDAIQVLAFSARVSGWPAWAVVTGFEGSCEQGGGVDEVPGTCALTCASDPATVDGPDVVLGAFLYRGPKPLDAGQLGLSAQVVDPTLALPDATVELVTP